MMTKQLQCGTVVPGCEAVLHAETDAELLMKATDHARSAHGLERISDALKAKILTASEQRQAACAGPGPARQADREHRPLEAAPAR